MNCYLCSKIFLMRKKILGIKLLLIISLIVLLSLLLFVSLVFIFPDYLSKTEKVNANILVVEGWIPSYALDMAIKEFENDGYDLIITTGIKIAGYYQVSMDGYLIFYTGNSVRDNENFDINEVEVDAYSELNGPNAAHFNLYINDSLIKDVYATTRRKKYEVNWKGKLSSIDSVMVQFDNDMRNKEGDRNLYVKEIIFNHQIHIPFQNNSEYVIGTLDSNRRIKNNCTYFSELARNFLLSKGLDSSSVISVPGNGGRGYRTLSSAIAFRDWLKVSDINVKGINIITLGAHAKRSWMTYRKVLNPSYKIGIISLPDYINYHSRRSKLLKITRETVGIIYYWIILNFY